MIRRTTILCYTILHSRKICHKHYHASKIACKVAYRIYLILLKPAIQIYIIPYREKAQRFLDYFISALLISLKQITTIARLTPHDIAVLAIAELQET